MVQPTCVFHNKKSTGSKVDIGKDRALRATWIGFVGARALLLTAAIGALLASSSALAATQTWQGGTVLFSDTATGGSPQYDDWANSTNWTPGPFPNATTDSAAFGSSANTRVGFSQDVTVGSVAFNAGASSYNFLLSGDTTVNPTGHTVTISGSGVSDSSGVTQIFEVRGFSTTGPSNVLQFTNGATSGDAQILVRGAANSTNAHVEFSNSSNAGPSIVNMQDGELDFHDASS